MNHLFSEFCLFLCLNTDTISVQFLDSCFKTGVSNYFSWIFLDRQIKNELFLRKISEHQGFNRQMEQIIFNKLWGENVPSMAHFIMSDILNSNVELGYSFCHQEVTIPKKAIGDAAHSIVCLCRKENECHKPALLQLSSQEISLLTFAVLPLRGSYRICLLTQCHAWIPS